MYKRFVTIVLGIFVIILGLKSFQNYSDRQSIVYADSLDEIIVTVDGNALTLADIAYYIGNEEMNTEKQALVYKPQQPQKYWNAKVGGQFVRMQAKNNAMNKAIHDEIFYQMALERGLDLDEEDMLYISNVENDFWYDLCDMDNPDALGVTREQLDRTIEKSALAYKSQIIYAELEGADVSSFDFSGNRYEELLNEHKYEIEMSLWRKVNMGRITTGR